MKREAVYIAGGEYLCMVYRCAEVDAALATERQSHAEQLAAVIVKWTSTVADLQESHAAQLAEKDATIKHLETEYTWQRTHRADADTDLTAARAEIARLTEVVANLARPDVTLGLIQRAEAAEASLLALQQQMEAVLLRMNVSGTWGAVEKLIAEARAALASSLTGRSQ